MIHHSYILLTPLPTFSSLSEKDRTKYEREFLKAMSSQSEVIVETYATLGLKASTSIMLWLQSMKVDQIQDLIRTLLHTSLGGHLAIAHTLFGMTRPTQYSTSSQAESDTARRDRAYLIIYPFSKTKEWYMLDFETRKKMMSGHITIGKKYPKVSQILLYSFGVDDQEFIVSYETDDLSMFQSLVMKLRSDPVRTYTLQDTPLFLCIYRPPTEVLTYL